MLNQNRIQNQLKNRERKRFLSKTETKIKGVSSSQKEQKMYSLLFLTLLFSYAAATDNEVCSETCTSVECGDYGSCDGFIMENEGVCECCSICGSLITPEPTEAPKPTEVPEVTVAPETTVTPETAEATVAPEAAVAPETNDVAEPEAQPACATERDRILEHLQKNPSLLGLHPPLCDEDGTYAPKQCIESMCRCVDKEGSYLKDYKARRSQGRNMHCKCAREEESLRGLIGKYVKCQTNGNYESKQCLGSQCYCADNEHGTQIGESVHISLLDTMEC